MEAVVFLGENFPPPVLCRDTGTLGFLHKRVLGECRPSVKSFLPCQLFPLLGTTSSLRVSWVRALLTMRGMRDPFSERVMFTTDCTSLSSTGSGSEFHKELTKIARRRCMQGDTKWRDSFHSCSELWRSRTFMDTGLGNLFMNLELVLRIQNVTYRTYCTQCRPRRALGALCWIVGSGNSNYLFSVTRGGSLGL